MAVVAAVLTTTGCWNFPELDDPAFQSFLAGGNVWLEANSFNALPAGSRMDLDPALLGRWNELGKRTAACAMLVSNDKALMIDNKI